MEPEDARAQAAEVLFPLVELRYFGGLELSEIAEVLGPSERTAKRDWAYAKAWLYREVRADEQ